MRQASNAIADDKGQRWILMTALNPHQNHYRKTTTAKGCDNFERELHHFLHPVL